MKKPLPTGKTYHTTFLVASKSGLLSEYLRGVLESVNPEFAPSHGGLGYLFMDDKKLYTGEFSATSAIIFYLE